MAKEEDTLSKLLKFSEKYKTDVNVEYLDTGSIILNMVMGGGLPLSKNIQIYSESGYGKSTITMTICKAICKQGRKVLYFDAEGSVNDNLLRTMGILTDDPETNLLFNAETNPNGPFIFMQLPYYEMIEEVLESLIPKYDEKTNYPIESDFALVVIDSVAALAPKEYYADNGEKLSIASNKPGINAKILAAFLRKFNGYKTMFNMSFIYINQLRENLSMGYGSKYEDQVPGGKAMKFYTDILLKLNSGGVVKKKVMTGCGDEQEVAVEREVSIIAKKNKITDGNIALPLQVIFGKGISNIAAVPKILSNKNIVNYKGETVKCIVGSGAWFTVTLGEKEDQVVRCNGKEQVNKVIRENYAYIMRELIVKEDYHLLEKVQDESI